MSTNDVLNLISIIELIRYYLNGFVIIIYLLFIIIINNNNK